MPPITFRNVARYVQDVEANLPLYQALGFEVGAGHGHPEE